jgi:NADH dehydrogenase
LLLERHVEVRAAARSAEALRRPAALGASTVEVDVRDPGTLRSALQDVDHVVAAYHGLVPPSRSNTPAAVDLDGTRALITAARAAGVEHLTHVSIFGAAPDHPIDFWRHKYTAEQTVMSSGLDHTIVRPTSFAEIHVLRLLGIPITRGRPIPLIGRRPSPRNYVSADDVASVIVDAVVDGAHRGQAVEVVGPENLTPPEVIRLLERHLDRRARVIRLPRTVAAGTARVLRPLHPGVARLLELGAYLDVHGDPAAPDARSDRVVGPTSVADVVTAWATSIT